MPQLFRQFIIIFFTYNKNTFFFFLSCIWNPHGSTMASIHLVWMDMCSLDPTVCVCFVMKCAYSSPDLLTLFCNLQAWKRSCVCVCVLYHYATLHMCLQRSARLYKLRSLKVPWLPRASADVMHEESSCLFTLPKGMLKSRTAEMLSFKSVGTAGSVKSFIWHKEQDFTSV